LKTKKLYCGIDVSSDTLDICYQTAEGKVRFKQVENNQTGFNAITKTCGKNYHYVMENTGIYHTSFMFYLHRLGLEFSVVSALQVKRYIQMRLERSKSDKKDAKRICEYGIDRNPKATKVPDMHFFLCRTLNNAIHDLTKDITCMSNRIHSLSRVPYSVGKVMSTYKSILMNLKMERNKLEKILDTELRNWQPELVDLVQSVNGVGKRVTAEIIIYTNGFKDMKSYKQLISYAGLSPLEYSSGKSVRGKARICKQGGKLLRHVLYMAALTAKSTNSACKALYDRLVEKGKNKKAALIAVCNKLLKQVFGCVKNRVKYQNYYVSVRP
jgi:transposase